MLTIKYYWDLKWDYTGWENFSNKYNPYTQKDWDQTLVTKINQISAQIFQSNNKGGANTLRGNETILKILESLEYFDKETNKLSSRYDFILDNMIIDNHLYVYRNFKHNEDLYLQNPKTFELELVNNNELKKELRKKWVGRVVIENFPDFKDSYWEKRIATPKNNLHMIKAPEPLHEKGVTVFLAGSIEMGTAIDWQKKIEDKLREKMKYTTDEITLFNPRRDDWDSSWEQTIENEKFREQVEWELNALDVADKIVVYIDPNTTSPITLLEIGLYADSNKICIYCPEGFYRKGNVDVVCKKYGIPMANDIDDLIKFILK